MRLEQKYFVPFILAGAVITVIFIVISSFNFTDQRKERFTEYAQGYTALLTKSHPLITQQDSLRLGDLSGSKVLVVFWASWSDKSTKLMDELAEVSSSDNELSVVAALVKDATSSAEEILPNYDFRVIDGTLLFNELRTPGIPSYFFLNENGMLLSTHVGFKKGEIAKHIDELLK